MRFHQRSGLILAVALGALAFLALPAPRQKNGQQDILLQKAIQKETVDGDLNAAVEMYKKIVAESVNNRAVAAKALLRLAGCYEKLGQEEARKTYRQLINDYPEHQEEVRLARARLARLMTSAMGTAPVTIRKLDQLGNDKTLPWNVSADGRYLGATDYNTHDNAAIIDLVEGKSWTVSDYSSWDDEKEKGYVDQTAISRDGKTLAYWHYIFSGTDGGIWLVGRDGKGRRLLFKPDFKDYHWARPQDWSPDGRYLAVRLTGREAFAIVILPVDSGKPRVVKTFERSRGPSKLKFSPDGRFLAYHCPVREGATQTDVYVIPVEGSPESAIAPHTAVEEFVGWTPKGDILLLSDRTGTQDLYRVEMREGTQTGEPELLRSMIGPIGSLGMNSAGALYYSSRRPIWNAYYASMDLETGKFTSKPQKVTNRFEGAISMPSWSPEGKFFSYLHHQVGGAAHTLIIRDTTTGLERELLPALKLHHFASMARFLPGAEAMIAHGLKGDQHGLFRIRVDTGETTHLLPLERSWDGFGKAAGDWTPDGKVLFLRDGDSIQRRNLETGEQKIICTGLRRSRTYRISPDGKHLVFVEFPANAGGDWRLRVIPTDGGEVRDLVKYTSGSAYTTLSTAWSPDGRYVLFVSRTPDPTHELSRWTVWTVPADGSREARSTELKSKGLIGEISFDPNNNRFAYSVWGFFEIEYWTMENFLPKSK